MANTKISAATAATTIADADQLPLAVSGASKSITGLALKKDVSFTKASSFPGTPATNQMCFRTDLGLLCYYDGTRWLTVNMFETAFGAGTAIPSGLAATGGAGYLPTQVSYDMWLVDWSATTFILTTNDGTNFWTFKLQKTTAANVASDIDAGFSTGTGPDTPSNWVVRQRTLGVAVGGSATYKQLAILATKTLSPGNVYFSFTLRYRLIIT